MAGKSKSNVFEIASRALIASTEAANLPDIALELKDHESSASTNAHQISNVTGLQAALDGKQSVLTGFTGSFSVVTHVDFSRGAVITKTITVSNGVIVDVI